MCTGGFPAGTRDGHHLINRTNREATFIEVGTRWPGGDEGDYSDIDMRLERDKTGLRYLRKTGEPYPARKA